jgi:hypothetical protein
MERERSDEPGAGGVIENSESDAVILQVAEVVVAAQVSTGHEDLIFYSAVITS